MFRFFEGLLSYTIYSTMPVLWGKRQIRTAIGSNRNIRSRVGRQSVPGLYRYDMVAVETIRSKIMKCLNTSNDTLRAVQKSMDTFEKAFAAKVARI